MIENKIHLDAFEGPLDLLLTLISKHEVDIYDIPIVEITNQYLKYIYTMNELNIELASEFIVMASTLIEIKSKMLLPPEINEDNEEIDPRDELVNRLLEYKIYKHISSYFKDYDEYFSTLVSKDQSYFPQFKYEDVSYTMDVDLFNSTIKNLLLKNQIRLEDLNIKYSIESDPITTAQKLEEINILLKKNSTLNFFDIIGSSTSIKHVIVTFLAVLEMLKLNLIHLEQNNMYEEIKIVKVVG